MGIADNTPQRGYCLYAHINPINDKVYIGISKDVKKRWAGKIHAYKHSSLIQNALKKYGWDNFIHVVICDGLTFEEACKKEQQWIFAYKREGMSYNITNGGEGHLGIPLTQEQKENLKKIHTGKVVSSETRKKQSEAQMKNSVHRKKVYAFDKNSGELVKEYNSLAEAAKDTHSRDSNISEAASGRNYTAAGYVWGYTPIVDSSRLNHTFNRESRRKKIYCYDLNGTYIKTYNCAYDAVAEVGGSYKGIHSCCAKQRLTYKGFIWRHEFCIIEPDILTRIKR